MRSVIVYVSVCLASTLGVACSSNVQGTGAPTSNTDAGAASNAGTKDPFGVKGSADGGTSTKPAPNGNAKTCKTAALCASDCPDNDDACAQACIASLSDAEMGKLQAVGVCINGSGCQDDACIQQTCATEIQTCIGN
jgi:hypothetical protein